MRDFADLGAPPRPGERVAPPGRGRLGRRWRRVARRLTYASPPILWGTEDYVRERFAPAATEFAFEREVNRIEWESADGFADFFMDRFGPMVTARAMLGERFADLRAEIVEIWRKANESNNGGFVLPQQYLLSVVRR